MGRSTTLHEDRASDAVLPRSDEGTLAGRYRLESVLGAGGIATVYAATDLRTGEDVAVKTLHDRATPSNIERLRREARFYAAVEHPNVCRLRALKEDRGVPFLVMDRLCGETVRQRTRRCGPLSGAEAVTVTIQLLDALEECHVAGILHRDVKPANVFLQTVAERVPSRVVLIDFGLSRALPRGKRRKSEATITTVDVIPGTPQYLTPEQICGVRDLDGRVDVWGVGMTLFEMTTGRRPFRGPAVYDVLVQQILLERIPPLTSIRPDLPAELDDVLARALAKDRRDRFESPRAFRNALVSAWAAHRAREMKRGEAFRRDPAARLREPPCAARAAAEVMPIEPPEIEIIIESSSSALSSVPS